MATVLPVCSNGAPLYIHSSRATDPNSATASIADAKYADGTDAFDKFDNKVACADCERKGPLFANRCRHMTTRLPHFRRETDAKFIEAVMDKLPIAKNREILNLDTGTDRTPIFARTYMEWMVDGRNLYQRYDEIDTFFTIIDPSAGAHASEYAILSMAFVPFEIYDSSRETQTRCVLLGADVMRTNISIQVATMVRRHIEEVRAIPGLSRARGVVCPEANSNDAANIGYHVRDLGISNIELFTEVGSNGVVRRGQHTNQHNRPEMFKQIIRRVRENAVVFHRDFCQACPELAIDESSREITIKHLMNGYRKPGKVGLNGIRGPEIYTGKDPETGAQDDMLMCLAMGQVAYSTYLLKNMSYM